MQERKNIVLKIQRQYKSLPSTEIGSIDGILRYMLLKAAEKDIDFDVVLAGSVKESAQSKISTQKLGTLLADLLENAIIATSYSIYRRIQLTMGIVDNCFEIAIQDSGIPFEVETLARLGKKKATTHADIGGSGIGYITIFEILSESDASLTITEYAPEEYAFTKTVKVRFDGETKCYVGGRQLFKKREG